jgi:hypothetical protein
MDWANERYVRIYTRDTRTTKLVGWEGRAVLWEVLRKVDRAGVMEGVRTAEDLALMVDIPLEFVRVALDRMISVGAVELSDMGLVVPNYLPAQETPQSDRQRQRESRQLRAARARSDVTFRDTLAVTKRDRKGPFGHAVSHAVTPCHSVPSLAVPSLASKDPPSEDCRAVRSTESAEEQAVFDRWRATHRHPTAKLDQKRRARIRARMREGFTVDQLSLAIDGAKLDPFLMGEDPRASRVYDGIETLLRDRAQVERLIELNGSARPAKRPLAVRESPSEARARQHAEHIRDLELDARDSEEMNAVL